MGNLSVDKINELTKPNDYGDGRGLYLQVKPSGRKSWVFRYKVNRKTHWLGLGSFPEVSPEVARVRAADAKKLRVEGKDPLVVRQEQAKAKAAAEAAARAEKQAIENTFAKVAGLYIAAHEIGWRNAKHRQQWTNTLTTYAFPVLGTMPVREITVAVVRRVLTPIWREKPETASRLRGRIEVILNYATAEEWRTGDNPARLDGPLGILLGPHGDKAEVEHHAALPWAEIADFMVALDDHDAVAARAMKLLILTATRTSETLNATWGEIAMDAPGGPVWTIPEKRMKAGKTLRVPLSEAALGVLAEVAALRAHDGPDAPVFPGQTPGKPLSNMAMLMLLRRMGRDDLTAHGFRSTFRDWVAEATSHQREIAEAALAHAVGGVEGVYQRGDLLAKRRKLMDEWAAFCCPPAADDRIVPMRKAG
jgi:integrase